MSRTRTRVLTAGAVTAAVALAGAGYGMANAADERPAVAFVAATKNVVAERYIEGEDVWFNLDLGVHIIAGDEPFEIHAKRQSYAKPIGAERLVTGADGKRTSVPVPDGLVTDFDGFDDFTEITIADAATGATVKQYQTDFCPNTYDSARTRRDAPADNPYPESCAGGNPFLLGSVWGVQAGWNAATESTPRWDWNDGPSDFDLQPGKYKATVVLNPKYREFLGVPESDATVEINLTVENVVYGEEELTRAKAVSKAAAVGVRLAPEKAAAGDPHSRHATEGDENAQISAFVPEFRPPAKRPETLAAAPTSGPRPDLRSLPAWGIELTEDDGKWFVNFSATVWNAGRSPLRVDGFRRTGGEELMDAYQYFFDAKGREVGSVEAGTMEWDPRDGHRHWHFTDFAQYSLLNADKTSAVRSGKEAFCLVNTDAVDYTVPNAKWRPSNTDLGSSCGQNSAVAVREVLDVGNGDTYGQYLPGQNFEITDLPNGTYYIEVLANPVKKLAESNTNNNSALRKIVLGGTPEKRTLRVPAVHGIDG